MKEVSKKQFIKGSIWKIIEQFSTKGVSLLVSIVLARLLSPEAYGLIALTVVFTNLSDILLDGGFSTALIRKKEVDDCDYSCVMVVSFLLATILYAFLFCGAPAIANFYNEPQLISILRVIGLILFIQAFSAVRTAVVNRNMQFKLLFRCNFFGALISGIIGIVTAYMGMDVWALVIQRLLQLALSTLFLFISIKWKFRFHFDFRRLKEIFSFSIGVVTASLINYACGSIYSLVVGKKYSVTDLGYSDKGAQLPQQASLYTFGAMSSVLLPTLSSYQSDMEKFKRIVRKVFQMTSYMITPMMVGLALVSNEIISILFTDKWLPAVPIMQANCIYYFATPFMLICVQIFFALGHSKYRVKTEIIRMILQVTGILIFGLIFNCSIYQLAYVCAGVAILSAIVTYFEASKMINYSFGELLTDIIKPIVASVLMGLMIYGIGILYETVSPVHLIVVSLAIKVVSGVIIYLLLSIILKIKGFYELKGLLKR